MGHVVFIRTSVERLVLDFMLINHSTLPQQVQICAEVCRASDRWCDQY